MRRRLPASSSDASREALNGSKQREVPPPQGRTLISGAGTLSIMTLIQAGLPLASERSIAPGSSSAAAPIRHGPPVRPRPGRSASAEARSRTAIRAVVAHLKVVFRVPARIGADDGDKGQTATHRGLELRHVKAECAVAQHDEHRSLGSTTRAPPPSAAMNRSSRRHR